MHSFYFQNDEPFFLVLLKSAIYLRSRRKSAPKRPFDRSMISSFGRARDCSAWGRRWEPRVQTSTQGCKITEKWRYTSFAQQTARPLRGSDDHVKWRSRLQYSRRRINSVLKYPLKEVCILPLFYFSARKVELLSLLFCIGGCFLNLWTTAWAFCFSHKLFPPSLFVSVVFLCLF